MKPAEEVAREMVSDLVCIADDHICAAPHSGDEVAPVRGIVARLVERSRAKGAAAEREAAKRAIKAANEERHQ